jgi:hypothetical protein
MAQFARPSADTVRTGWTDQAAGTVNIYQAIDETSASDADYIKTATPPGANEYETLLTSVTDPLSSTGHIMRWRRRKQPASGSAQMNLTVRLLQGTTQITSQADNNLPGTFTDTSYTLSAGEADAITNYADLRKEFVATQV